MVHPESGDIFITDGYGNSRVHKYDSNGNHIMSWGSPGALDGQFSLPHNICLLGGDKLVVADRENFRIQIFSLDGEYLGQKHMHRPIAASNGRAGDDRIYVAEAGAPAVQKGVRNLGNRVVVLDMDFERGRLLRWRSARRRDTTSSLRRTVSRQTRPEPSTSLKFRTRTPVQTSIRPAR